MPLASLFGLQWYGPGLAGMVVNDSAGAVVALAIGDGRIAAVGSGAGNMPLARATRLVNSPAIMSGTGGTAFQEMRAYARAGALIQVNELSQDDVTGAVMESVIEGDLTLRQAMRLLLSHAQGNATGLESGSLAFKSLDGSRTRIAGTVAAGVRTITARDVDP